MEKITKTYDVYKYDGLSKEAQQKVIEDNHDINTDYEWFESDFECMIEELTKKGFDDAEIFFSGFYSQGDGACFTANLNVEKIMKYFKLATKYTDLLKKYVIPGNVKADNHHYCHSNVMYLDIELDAIVDIKRLSIAQQDALSDVEEELRIKLFEIAKNEADKIYATLQKTYEHLTSEDVIIETIKENEYVFLKDGKRFNE